jgi:DNA-binding NarL/FixJ family response regulator
MIVARILIADDHDVVRHGLRRILQAQNGWQVVAEAVDCREAIAKAVETKPDVAVLDQSMPGMSGLQVTREIRAQVPSTEVVIFATDRDDMLACEFLSAGARHYLLKSNATNLLIAAIKSLLARPCLSPRLSTEKQRPCGATPDQMPMLLTPRERMVVQLVAEGHSNKSMAYALGISIKTVETHRSAVMRKLDLSSSATLVRYAIRNHIARA